MKIKILICLLLSFSNPAVGSSYQMNRNCREAYDYILSLRFSKAEELLRSEKKSNPENRIIIYLENYADFLRVIISEDKSLYQKFSSGKQKTLDLLGSGDKHSPWHLYSQAQLQLQQSIASLRFEDYRDAAVEINRFYRLINENSQKFPGFLPNKTALGLMQVLVGSIPQNYQWISRLLSLQGTVEQGMSNMQSVLTHNNLDGDFPYLKAETLFLLTFTTFNLSQIPEEMDFLEEYLFNPGNSELIRNNPLLIYARSVYLMHTGKNDAAIETLMHAPVSKEYYPFYYLQYLTGQAKLNRQDKDADIWFLRYVTNFKGNSFIKSAYQRLAWISLLEGDETGYYNYIFRLQQMGNTIIDGDKSAQKEASSKKIPHPVLLKSRLLFDGGYYAEADKVISTISVNAFADEHDQTEYYYRKARIYHKWGKIDKAKKNYEQTIILGENKKWFFAANAALNLGFIHEDEGNYELARQYFRKSLSMNYDEYHTSISQKARAGLGRLERKK